MHSNHLSYRSSVFLSFTSVVPSLMPVLIPFFRPAYRSSYCSSYRPSYRPSYCFSYRPSCRSSVIHTALPSFVPSYLSSYRPTFLPTVLPFFIPKTNVALTHAPILANCDASEILSNAETVGDCSAALPSGGSCTNTGRANFLGCTATTCFDGVLSPGLCAGIACACCAV